MYYLDQNDQGVYFICDSNGKKINAGTIKQSVVSLIERLNKSFKNILIKSGVNAGEVLVCWDYEPSKYEMIQFVKELPSINFDSTTTTFSSTKNSTSTTFLNNYSTPERIKVIENQDSIEFIYKETLMFNNNNFFTPTQQKERVFKIVFSCVDGKWNKSKPIYGEINPAIEESFVF